MQKINEKTQKKFPKLSFIQCTVVGGGGGGWGNSGIV